MEQITKSVISRPYMIIGDELFYFGKKTIVTGKIVYGGSSPSSESFYAWKKVDEGKISVFINEKSTIEIVIVRHKDSFSLYLYNRSKNSFEKHYDHINKTVKLGKEDRLLQKEERWYLNQVEDEFYLGKKVARNIFRKNGDYKKATPDTMISREGPKFADMNASYGVTTLSTFDKNQKLVEEYYQDSIFADNVLICRKYDLFFDLYFKDEDERSANNVTLNVFGKPMVFTFDEDKKCFILKEIAGIRPNGKVKIIVGMVKQIEIEQIDKSFVSLYMVDGILKTEAETVEETRSFLDGEVSVLKRFNCWYFKDKLIGKEIIHNLFYDTNSNYLFAITDDNQCITVKNCKITTGKDENDNPAVFVKKDNDTFDIFIIDDGKLKKSSEKTKLIIFKKYSDTEKTSGFVYNEENKSYTLKE